MRVFQVLLGGALAAALIACGGGGAPARVELPLASSGEALPAFDNDLGFRVELRAVTLPMRDLQLTGRGDQHARRRGGPLEPLVSLLSSFVSAAHAHPGHEAGGAVLGERLGAFDARFGGGAPESLGTVTVLEGALRGGAFRLRGDAPLRVEGEAVRGDGSRLEFTLETNVADGILVEGIPLELDVTAGTRGTLVLRVLPTSTRGRTLLDAVDFTEGAFDEAAARNAVARALQDHAHHELVFQREEE